MLSSCFKTISLTLLIALVLVVGCQPGALSNGENYESDGGIEDSGTSTIDADDEDADPTTDTDPSIDASPDSDDEEPVEPHVAFSSPTQNSSVDNPVIFQISSVGIDEVEIFADETYSLGPAFDPAIESEFLYRFVGTGSARSLHMVGRTDGQEVARADLIITVNPDSCEDRFFLDRFATYNQDASGDLEMVSIRETSLAAIKEEIASLQSCGADLTLGAMMSLLMWEAAFRAGSFNTKCNENSYHNTESGCDAVAEAFYSYQFGIGGMHTSNFHPCKGGAWTQGMRELFTEVAAEAGYSTSGELVTDQTATRFAEVCPDATPAAVDHYILGAHEPFGIPRNDNGNHLEAVGHFPFHDPHVSVPLTFHILQAQCDDITGDRDAMARWGGGDDRYSQQDHQDSILAHYENYAAAHCDP